MAFTFDYVDVPPSQQIGLHLHPQWEVNYIISGRGTRSIGDTTAVIEPGEIILIPPYIPHVWSFDIPSTDSNKNIENIAVFFETPMLDGLMEILPELFESITKLKNQTEAIQYTGPIAAHIRNILSSMKNSTPEHRLPGMMDLLISLTNSECTTTVGSNTVLNKAQQRMEKIRVFCSCNYMRNITLSQIATHIGINKSALCTFVLRHSGMRMSEYVNNFRLEKAMERLKYSDENIASIAYDVGYSSVTYFNRLFKAKFGNTPKFFRTPPKSN